MTIRISHGEGIILQTILDSDKPLTIADIISKSRYSKDTVRTFVNSCAEEGLLKRNREGHLTKFYVPSSMTNLAKKRIADANPMTKASRKSK